MSSKLDPDQFEAFQQKHPEWVWKGGHLEREWRFPDFKGSLGFVNRVGELAEKAQHHPDVDIRYDRVLLRLSTHTEGTVTERDLSLAKQIDALD
ncbi:MAG: 4a-hydroxytetrahydrobiopterin dehydratase [Candidatus Eisenbacteria bacterium]|nr:4a-hydroxytetrahydrobiopterin dehydratase [Candidatus Latescibacterota bacterium]MBD3302683.1 4a-hydroxytetrahydrobiopterin dehydratase [Candidatus Eisenbacteria bacterium]